MSPFDRTFFVISDIHGDADCLQSALELYWVENDRFENDFGFPMPILILGDILYHGPRNPIPEGYRPKEVAQILNQIKDRLTVIRGNCDADVDQMMLQMPIMAKYMSLPLPRCGQNKLSKLIVTHGHHNKELYDLQPGDVLLQGHTHVLKAQTDEATGVILLNPGSISLPKEGNPKTAAVLTTGKENSFTVKTMDGNEVLSIRF